MKIAAITFDGAPLFAMEGLSDGCSWGFTRGINSTFEIPALDREDIWVGSTIDHEVDQTNAEGVEWLGPHGTKNVPLGISVFRDHASLPTPIKGRHPSDHSGPFMVLRADARCPVSLALITIMEWVIEGECEGEMSYIFREPDSGTTIYLSITKE